MAKLSAQEYLTKSENQLRAFKRDWESFTREAPDKFMSLVRSGIRPTVSSNSYGNQIGVTLNFESNMDAAKEYIEKVKVKIDTKSDEISKHIKDMDKDLQAFLDEGVDSDVFTKLVRNLNDWVAYIPKMSFEMAQGKKIEIAASDETLAIKKKWDEVSAEEVRKKEAEKYGISLADLDKHKGYLDAKSQKASAKTSTAMKKAERAFVAIKGYLDSDALAKECASAAAELKKKEDEEARIKKEQEEARKKAEAERLRKAIEAYELEVAEVTKAREAYIAEETAKLEKKHSAKLAELRSAYEKACEANRKAASEAESEKQQKEQELEAAGIFAFSKKKELRLSIESLSERLRVLANEKKSLDSSLKDDESKENSAYSSSLKTIPMNAGKKFAMPKDPRK